MNTLNRKLGIVAMTGLLVGLSGCAKMDWYQAEAKKKEDPIEEKKKEEKRSSSPVCDPYAVEKPVLHAGASNGLKGTIHFANIPLTTAYSMASFPNQTMLLDNSVFFGQVRYMDQSTDGGLFAKDGNEVQKSDGSSIINMWYLDASGYIGLNPGDSEGDYQFMIIHNGAVNVTIGNVVIQDDARQTNRMTCSEIPRSDAPNAAVSVHLAPGQTLPIRIRALNTDGHTTLTLLKRRVFNGPGVLAHSDIGNCGYDHQGSGSNDWLQWNGWRHILPSALSLPANEPNSCFDGSDGYESPTPNVGNTIIFTS